MGLSDWLKGEKPRPADAPVEVAEDFGESVSFSTRLIEPIRLETTIEQHADLLRAVGTTSRTKAELIRAAIALSLPALVANPEMVDLLQPGKEQENNGLEDREPACLKYFSRQRNGGQK